MTKKEQFYSNIKVPYEQLAVLVDDYNKLNKRDIVEINAYLVAVLSAMVAYIDTVWKLEHEGDIEPDYFIGCRYANNMVKHSKILITHVDEIGGFSFPLHFPFESPKVKVVWKNQKLDTHHKDTEEVYNSVFAGKELMEPLDEVMRLICPF